MTIFGGIIWKKSNMSLCVTKPTIWVSNTNQPVQSPKIAKRKIAKSLKFRMVEEENKGSYCEADLRLCFRLCRLLFLPCGGSNIITNPIQINFHV